MTKKDKGRCILLCFLVSLKDLFVEEIKEFGSLKAILNFVSMICVGH
jgi:hypothetical protein